MIRKREKLRFECAKLQWIFIHKLPAFNLGVGSHIAHSSSGFQLLKAHWAGPLRGPLNTFVLLAPFISVSH